MIDDIAVITFVNTTPIDNSNIYIYLQALHIYIYIYIYN